MSSCETEAPGGPAHEAGCGPACVSARRCTCAAGQDEAAPRETAQGVWAPQECTLPVIEQPGRVAEFDALLPRAVRAMTRPEPTRLRLVLYAAYETTAGVLAARESGCCPFFTFAFTGHGEDLHWEITVPDAQVAVLDALAERAAATLPEVAW